MNKEELNKTDAIHKSCQMCGDTEIKVKFKIIGSKIYWSEHDEIKNLYKFTRYDRFYSSDNISKECLIIKCKNCGYKEAVSTIN